MYKIQKFQIFESLVNKDPNVKIGDKLRLIFLEDKYSKLQPGSIGLVDSIDAIGTLHMKWSDGSTLGLIPNVDKYEVVATDESFNYNSYDIRLQPHMFKDAYMCSVYKDAKYVMGLKGPTSLEAGKEACLFFVDAQKS